MLPLTLSVSFCEVLRLDFSEVTVLRCTTLSLVRLEVVPGAAAREDRADVGPFGNTSTSVVLVFKASRGDFVRAEVGAVTYGVIVLAVSAVLVVFEFQSV